MKIYIKYYMFIKYPGHISFVVFIFVLITMGIMSKYLITMIEKYKKTIKEIIVFKEKEYNELNNQIHRLQEEIANLNAQNKQIENDIYKSIESNKIQLNQIMTKQNNDLDNIKENTTFSEKPNKSLLDHIKKLILIDK